MKRFLIFCIYALLSLLIFGGIIYGYGSILNDFDLQCTGEVQELFALLRRSTFQDGIVYLILSYLLWFLYKWDFPIIKPASILVAFLLLSSSFLLLWKNFHRYKEILDYECDSFVFLIQDFGSIVHLFYILPFIFAVIHAVYVGFLYFKFKRKSKE